MKSAWLAAITCVCLGLSLACSKKTPPPRRTAPWLANPSASDTVGEGSPVTYHFANDSSVRFSMRGPRGAVKGRVPLGNAELRLDPNELKNTRATLELDLTRLSAETESAPEGLDVGGSPTQAALRWLELSTDVPPERRARFATARFELTSVEGLSAPRLDLGGGGKRGGIRASAIGTVLIHGFRAVTRAEVLIAPLPGALGSPARLSIRTTSALVLPLAPHDIAARGPSGVTDALATARGFAAFGKNARIEFDLVAEPDVRTPK